MSIFYTIWCSSFLPAPLKGWSQSFPLLEDKHWSQIDPSVLFPFCPLGCLASPQSMFYLNGFCSWQLSELGDPLKRRRCFFPPLEQKTEINPAPSGTYRVNFEGYKLSLKCTKESINLSNAIHMGCMKNRPSCGLFCTIDVSTVSGLSNYCLLRFLLTDVKTGRATYRNTLDSWA